MDGERLSLDDIKQSQDRLVARVESELDTLLWEGFRLPSDAPILDDPRNRTVGFSFATNPNNKWIRDSPVLQYIIKHRLDEFAVIDRSIPGGIIWKPAPCDVFMHAAFDIQKLLAIGIILTGRQPSRSTEYASMLYTHTPTCTVWNAYWMLDVLLILGKYNKSTAGMGQDAHIARIPLPKLGRQLARFLIYVRPIMIEWQRAFRSNLLDNAKSFLFMGLYRPVVPADFTLWLANWSSRELGIRMTVCQFHQFMAFLVKYHHRLFTLVAIQPPGMAAQLDHSQHTDTRNYGGDRQMLPGYDKNDLCSTALISAIIHTIFGHEPELLRTIYKSEAHMRILEEVIMAILFPSLPSTQYSLQQTAPLHAPELFTDAVHQYVVPAITSSCCRNLVDTFAALFDHLEAFQSLKAYSCMAEPLKIHPHPHLHTKLCTLMKHTTGLYGFKNPEQAIVTQLLYEGSQHVLYVSGTGIHRDSSSLTID